MNKSKSGIIWNILRELSKKSKREKEISVKRYILQTYQDVTRDTEKSTANLLELQICK